MTLAGKWVHDWKGAGRLVRRWAKEDLSGKREGDCDYNAPW